MKNRISIAFLFLLTAAGVQAQFRPMVRAYYYKALVESRRNSWAVEIGGDYLLSPHWGLRGGVGIGSMKYGKDEAEVNDLVKASNEIIVPIFAEIDYRFCKQGATPYLALNAGYIKCLSLEGSDDPGVFISPALGYSIPLTKNGSSIFLQLGYRWNPPYKIDTHQKLKPLIH